MGTVAEPVEGGYRLNGVKLCATNGTVATLLVITVERRNEFLGLHGLEAA